MKSPYGISDFCQVRTEAYFCADRTHLQTCRATLTARYGARLRLRTFAVVVLGFERLVWAEIAP